MSVRVDGITEEGEMVVRGALGGKVSLTLRRVLTDEDGPTISGAEVLRRVKD